MKNLKSIAVGVLVTAVSILTLISVLSIWGFLSHDILWKSISTIGVIAFASLIVILSAQALEHKNSINSNNIPPNPLQ